MDSTKEKRQKQSLSFNDDYATRRMESAKFYHFSFKLHQFSFMRVCLLGNVTTILATSISKKNNYKQSLICGGETGWSRTSGMNNYGVWRERWVERQQILCLNMKSSAGNNVTKPILSF